MMSLDDARARLASLVQPLPPRRTPLDEALGCRLAEDVVATLPLPQTDVSAMDGYAARRDDILGTGTLQVAFTIAAGDRADPLPPGAAARIFTGAALPRGADIVIPQEEAEAMPGGRVRLPVLAPRTHVRRRGELLAPGASIGRAGDVVTPARLALFAAQGASSVLIVPRPRVAVLATGSELVSIDAATRPGRLRDSNGPMLAALAREARFPVAGRARVGDDLRTLCDAVVAGADQADLVLTSGGVSVGDLDLLPQAIRELGGEILFHGLAIRPGKPTLAARVGAAWLVGLPGNPLACLVGWRLVALPLADALAGGPASFRESPHRARLAEALTNGEDRVLLRPARLAFEEGHLVARIVPWKGSHDLVAGCACDAIVRFEPRQASAAGEPVDCFPLTPFSP
jgi:molybdenum cofactor synthesis domain-containing protein